MADQNKENTTIEYQLYRADQEYKTHTNLINYIDEAQDFYNGKQYPNENYRNMVRLTMNICSFSVNIKASKICGTPIYLTYTSDNQNVDCTKLRQFDEYNCSKLKLKPNNFQASLNGFVNGTEITYIRWDDDDTSYKGIYKGGLVEEHIDPRNFAVANPYITDIQNQKWVMFWVNSSVQAVRDMVEGKDKEEIEAKKRLIVPEKSSGEPDELQENQYINEGHCMLFTRFFRVDGEVYFMCSTRNVNVFAYPHPLSRKVGKSIIEKVVDEYIEERDKGFRTEDGKQPLDNIPDYNIDYEDLIANSVNSKVFEDNEYKKVKEKFSLYPFAIFRPFNQNNSFYGRSDIKTLIPIQKGLNYILSMLLKCAENNAYNKIYVKPDALQGQEITNEPAQVIVDYTPNSNSWGIKAAESQPMPNGLMDYALNLFQMARTVYGFSDVMDGSIQNQDMSGYMLQQMIKQSNSAIEQQQQLFWTFNEEKAAIRLLYYKHYVDKAKYTYELTDAEYESEEQAREQLLNSARRNEAQGKDAVEGFPEAQSTDFVTPTHRVQTREITNEELYGVNFDIAIDAMQGLADSKLVEQQMWDNLLLNGGIQNIEPDILAMYLEASPNVSARTKSALKKVVDNLKNSENQKLKDQLNQLMQYTNEVVQYGKGLEEQLNYQKSYLEALTKEFTAKINSSNEIQQALMKDLENSKIPSEQIKGAATQPTTEGEVKSNNARGISGSTTQAS